MGVIHGKTIIILGKTPVILGIIFIGAHFNKALGLFFFQKPKLCIDLHGIFQGSLLDSLLISPLYSLGRQDLVRLKKCVIKQ